MTPNQLPPVLLGELPPPADRVVGVARLQAINAKARQLCAAAGHDPDAPDYSWPRFQSLQGNWSRPAMWQRYVEPAMAAIDAPGKVIYLRRPLPSALAPRTDLQATAMMVVLFMTMGLTIFGLFSVIVILVGRALGVSIR